MSPEDSAPALCAGRGASPDVPLEVEEHEVRIRLGDRSYRIRGLDRNAGPDRLRVSILAARDGLVHLDTLDLYQARSRAAFIRAAAEELYLDEALVKRDVGRLLLELEGLQQERIERARRGREEKVELSPERRRAAMGLLEDHRLEQRIVEDYAACGLVGEEANKLICYLGCISRKLPQPLAVLVRSGSAAGKTSLAEAALRFVPPEDQLRYSALTGRSLYYMAPGRLKHKVLSVAEEAGVAEAAYALKLLQSDGRLRIAAAGKNRGTGRQQTETYEVEGPVMMLLTTTAEAADEELENRCLVLQVNESAEQTAAIHARQRAAWTAEGRAAAARQQQIVRLHHDAQRLVQPLPVVLPWAEQLSFRTDRTRLRRDHGKYLALIASSALLHQYRRPHGRITVGGAETRYVEASPDDVRLANRLIGHVWGTTLEELLPQTRCLLEAIGRYVADRASRENKPRSAVRFTQRALRETLGWGDFQLRRHLSRLAQLEYVLVHRTGRGNQRAYELLYDGQGRSGERFLLGLADADELEKGLIEAPPEVRNDRLNHRNDARPMPIRSASDAPSMARKNRRNAKRTK